MSHPIEELLSKFIDLTKAEFPMAEVKLTHANRIRISQKAYDGDKLRPNKALTPIIISLHEDFGTSMLYQGSTASIYKEFSTFIVNKRAQFNPRTTKNVDEPESPEYWVFPHDC